MTEPSSTTTQPSIGLVDTALDIILGAKDLEDLCARAVNHPAANAAFQGAHVLFNTDGTLSYQAGFGTELPLTHLELAKATIAKGPAAAKELEFRAETPSTPAMVAIPFMHNNYAEAVGILLLHNGATQHYLDGDLSPIIAKLTGFYLETQYGLGN